MKKKHVLIVGAGPVGLLLAIELQKYGISIDIIEKLSKTSNYSKALSVSSASLKAFHGIGAIKEFFEAGKLVHDIKLYFNEKRMTHINMRYLDTIYNSYLSIPQPKTEEILENYLRNNGVYVDYQNELIELSQDTDRVITKIKTSEGLKESKYDYVIGCDGARSTVRKCLNFSFTGNNYNMHFIMADVYFHQDSSFNESAYYIKDDTFMIILPMHNHLYRIVIKKDGPLPSKRPQPTKEEVQFDLNTFISNPPVITDIIWSSSADFYNRLSNNRDNRVFLAGDAYHLFSPIGGQGMNTGIQDALNLGWKLAYYINKMGNQHLLSSYEDERLLAVNKTLNSTDLNTQLIARINFTDQKALKFKPTLSNRTYYRTELVEEFSGFLADYSDESNPLAGKHVSYARLECAEIGLESTYDIPKVKKNVLLMNELDYDKNTEEILINYSHILKVVTIKISNKYLLDKFKLNNQNLALVRPDGYIGYYGEKNQLLNYIQKYYLSKEAM